MHNVQVEPHLQSLTGETQAFPHQMLWAMPTAHVLVQLL